MDCFNYRDGILHAEEVPVPAIAAEVGTPVYVYSSKFLRTRFNELGQALAGLDHLICYAMKANSNQAVLKLLADMGAGFDAVSGGEYRRAMRAGAPGDRIVFSGVGKTRSEMRLALEGGIRHFNVESEPELDALNETAVSLGARAPVAIRVNPDVDAKTHRKISTGKSENKFGIPISRAREAYRAAAMMEGIEIVGVDMHIGSQLTSLEPFEIAFRKASDFVRALRADGHDIRRLDLGGGLGISYERGADAPPSLREYSDMLSRIVGSLGCEIEIEPGRLISGNAGILVSSVIYRKQGTDRTFLVLDAAMNDLLRPSMYDAYHEIQPVAERDGGTESELVDVVGPICETSDTFALRRRVPRLSQGELVAFRSAGAYGAVMASEYNTRPLVPEVLVDGSKFAVVRPRPDLDTIIARDCIPPWM